MRIKIRDRIKFCVNISYRLTLFIRKIITRDVLIFCSLVSFTVCLVALGHNHIKSYSDVMTAGGLLFTFIFSGWQYSESQKEKNCKNIVDIKNEIDERIDLIVDQFTKALKEIKDTGEKEDDKHNNEIESIQLKLTNLETVIGYIKEQLTHHLNSFGHNKTIEQQQEIIKQLADINALVTVSTEYAEMQLTIKNLSKTVKQLEAKLEDKK